MSSALTSPKPRGLALMLGSRRLLLALGVSALLGLIISPAWFSTPAAVVMGRQMPVGLAALLAFGLFEQWPARLPSWLARWALQVLGVAFAIPLSQRHPGRGNRRNGPGPISHCITSPAP